MVLTRSTEKKEAKKNVEVETNDKEDEEEKGEEEEGMDEEVGDDSSEDDRVQDLQTITSGNTATKTSLIGNPPAATTRGRRGGISGLPAGLSSVGRSMPGLSSTGGSMLSVTKPGLAMGRAGLTVASKMSSPSREGGATVPIIPSLPGLNNRPNTLLRSGISLSAAAAANVKQHKKAEEDQKADEDDYESDHEDSEEESAEEFREEGKVTDNSQGGGRRLLSGFTFAGAKSSQPGKRDGAESVAAENDGGGSPKARGLLAGLSLSNPAINDKRAMLDQGVKILRSEVKGGIEAEKLSPRLALSRLPPGMQVSKSRALNQKEEETKVKEGGKIEKEAVSEQISLKKSDQGKSLSRLPPETQHIKSDKDGKNGKESESDQSGDESESEDEGDQSADEEEKDDKSSKAEQVKPVLVTSTRQERSEDRDDGEEEDDSEDDLKENDQDGDDPKKGEEGNKEVLPVKPAVALSRLPPGMQITTKPASSLMFGKKKEERKEMADEEQNKMEVGTGRSSQGLAISRLPPGMQISRPVSPYVKAQAGSEKELDSSEEESEIEEEVIEGVKNGSESHVPKATSAVSRLPPDLLVGKSLDTTKNDEEGIDVVEMDDLEAGESDLKEMKEDEEEDEDVGGEGDEDLFKSNLPSGMGVAKSGLVILKPLSSPAPVEKSSDDEFEDIVEDEDSVEPAVMNEDNTGNLEKEGDDEKQEESNTETEKQMMQSDPKNKTVASQLQPFAETRSVESRDRIESSLAPLLPLRSALGERKKHEQHLTSHLQQLSNRLLEPDLFETVNKALGHDAVRNYTDAVQVLVLSGEEECTDTETKSLYCALTNIVNEESLAQFLEMDSLVPLSNFALRIALFTHLQKLVYKEPNLKELIVKEVGLDDLKEFDSVTSFYSERGDEFVRENVVRCTWLYHRVRNLSLHYVLKKLELVYTKMKPVLSRPSTDSGYMSSVALLSRLMAGSWREQVLLSEERNYDFDFLITILMYWKKEKGQPNSAEKSGAMETSTSKLLPKKTMSRGEGQMAKPADSRSVAAANPGLVINDRPAPSKVPQSTLPAGVSSVQQEKPNFGSVQDKSPALAIQDRSPVAVTAIHAQTMAGAQSPAIVGSLSVLSLHQVRDMLDRDEGAQRRVLGGVGQQAFSEFRNLVMKLTDTSVQIQDINVRTLYYTILNFANHPVTAAMRNFEPLSNFSLRVEPFLDLRRLLDKDANIQDVVRRQLGGTEVERFLARTAALQKEKKDFVVERQEENILLYHKLRNCIIDNLMSRLGKVHAKIKMVTLRSPPATFNIAVAMLESLMATHYNGQVLMMEKSKFDFDFLSTILSYLQQTNHGGPHLNESQISVSDDDLLAAAASVKSDLRNLPMLAAVKQLLGQEDFERQLKIVTCIEQNPASRGLDLVQRRAIHGLKNALFMSKNNILCSDAPLSNISLEVAKFSTLVKFISKDVGIKTAISLKFGEVALKELEALVMAHEERGDVFVTKFVDKNTSLYHGLRNTALEKILRQMGVVHGKVRHISLSSNARTPEYQVAIKALDSIVDADLPQKIRLIEEMKFEFDFLSTILMVWKTETSRQAEETKKVDERRRAEQEMGRLAARQDARRREMEEMPVEVFEERVDDPVHFNQLALPAPNMVVNHQQAAQRASFNNRRPFLSPRSSAFSSSTRPPLALPPPPRIATAADPMPVDPKAASELPIRTKCNLCPDKTSENVEQLIQHYSFMHFREQIEKSYVANWGECGKCGEKFTLKFNLIKHIGLVHRAVVMEITPTERWICKECQKEFLSDDFLKKHWIKAHLEREFEARFFVINESEELLCQFCEKTFSHKKNLFVHIGLDHDKLVELKPEYNTKDPKEKLLKCKNCDFAGDEDGLKAHLATTHYRQSLLALCLEEQALRPSSLNCAYCDHVSDSQELLVEHLGTDHSKVLRYVSHFQGKNVKMVFNTQLEGFKSVLTGDPLAQDPLADSEEELAGKKQEIGSTKFKGVVKARTGRRLLDNKALVSEIGSKITADTVVSSESLWVGRLKKFAEQQEGSLQMMLDGDFQDVASKVVGRFLETLTSEAEVEEAVSGLSKFCPGLKASRAVVRAKLVRTFKAHCSSLAVAPSSLPAMQTVILLSQLLGKPGASPGDLQPVLEAVGRLQDSHGEPLIVEFFKSIGQPLVRMEGKENKRKPSTTNSDGKSHAKVEEVVAPYKTIPLKKEEGKEKFGITMPTIPMSRVKLPNIAPGSPRLSSEQGPPTRVSSEHGPPTSISLEQGPSAHINSKLPLAEKPAKPDNQATELVEVKQEPILVAMERRQELVSGLDPECITLEEEEGDKEEKDYRFLCLDCEGEKGCKGAACTHTTHPRIPLEYDLSAHIVSTGHVDIRPLPQNFIIRPVMDVAYSVKLGAEVRKQWKELVLAGSHVPSQFTGVRRCKWAKCRQPFEDAVEAFKHIRDAHLKPLQTLKQSEAFPCNSLLEASVKVSSSTLEMKQTTGVTGKRVGESLVTLNKRMRVGN